MKYPEKKRRSFVLNPESVFWGVSLFAVSALFYFYDVPSKAVSSAVAQTQTPVVYPSASPQPNTKFSSLAACQSASSVGVLTKNSGAIAHPCRGNQGFYVWGNTTTVARDCVSTAAGVWTLYNSSKQVITRKIFTSSGANGNGTVFCSAIPFQSLDRYEYLHWDASAGFFRMSYYEDYKTPIVANHLFAYTNIYGVPKYWKDTTFGTNSNIPGKAEPAQVQKGVTGDVQWEY